MNLFGSENDKKHMQGEIHELATLKIAASSPLIRLPQGVNEPLVLGRASEVS